MPAQNMSFNAVGTTMPQNTQQQQLQPNMMSNNASNFNNLNTQPMMHQQQQQPSFTANTSMTGGNMGTFQTGVTTDLTNQQTPAAMQSSMSGSLSASSSNSMFNAATSNPNSNQGWTGASNPVLIAPSQNQTPVASVTPQIGGGMGGNAAQLATNTTSATGQQGRLHCLRSAFLVKKIGSDMYFQSS